MPLRCADNVWSGGTADGILNLDGGCALFAFGCGAAGFTRTGIMLQQSDVRPSCFLDYDSQLESNSRLAALSSR